MINKTEFANRRKQLLEKIGTNSIVILPSAPVARRNGDYDYPYRQSSDFYYLTGFEEPGAVALIIPHRKEGEFILFNRPKNRDQEIWEGIRAGQEGAISTYGADQSFAIDDFTAKLMEFLEGRDEIHYAFGNDNHFDNLILNAVNNIRGKIRNGLQSPIAFMDVTPTLHEMRLIKTPYELDLMRKAADISVAAHLRAMQFCKPGVYEYQLEAELLYEFNRHGARFPAYSSIVGSGGNSCILHYVNNNQRIKEDSVVLIDAGCEYQNYASDITRTFPAGGSFTDEQRAIYEIVLNAQKAGIHAVRPGALWSDIQDAIVKIITQGLLDIGLLKGKLSQLIEEKAYFKFYMHKSGHWLGLDVHDAGRYKIDGQWRKLMPNMVLTVEPGIYISADIPGVPKRFHNIGVRIEDDVVVTNQGCEVLSEKLPKEIAEIEKIVA